MGYLIGQLFTLIYKMIINNSFLKHVVCFSCLLSLPFLNAWANDEEDTGESGADDFEGIHLPGNQNNGLNPLIIIDDQGPMPLFRTDAGGNDDGDFFNGLEAALANNEDQPVIVLNFDLPFPNQAALNRLNVGNQGFALHRDVFYAALTRPGLFLSIY